MEVRAAATRSRTAAPTETFDVPSAAPAVASAGAVLAAGSRRSRRPSARSLVMNREQEYAYIREDLIRLVITASILLVLMLTVLFVVES
jgi:hypothetical protein